MTREEAKIFLYAIASDLGFTDVENYTCKDGEKMREAIKILEQESKAEKVIKMRDVTSEEQKLIDDYIKSISKPTGVDFGALEQEPCDDCISRQAAIDLPRIKTHNVWGNVIKESVDVEDIKKLPPVTPVERVGHWVDDNDGHGTSCSECDKWYPHSYIAKREIIYCCRCGAKMQESEVQDADSN